MHTHSIKYANIGIFIFHEVQFFAMFLYKQKST